jgi:tetraacyldisaccharide 4'-kinase
VKAPGFWTAPRPTVLARVLEPIGVLYGRATAQRMARPGARAGAPVICVGNFVAGGAGKTPAALALGRMLIADRRRVAFLSRGYGGEKRDQPILVEPGRHDAAAVGDEPLLLAGVAPTFVGADRVQSARLALHFGSDVLIMDDGLQNPALAKDLAFALVDGETGFGNGLCVPAGPLRAPLAAQAEHVGALIVVGGGDKAADDIRRAVPGRPVFRAGLEPDALAAAPLIGREVVAFCGIARPEKFYATLRRIGAQIVATRDFADHHRFTEREFARLADLAAERGALLVTTEKDLARLTAEQSRAVLTLPVTLRFDDPDGVRKLLRRALGEPRR